MLTSPTCDSNGYSNTFNNADFGSLKATGANRALATEANRWMKDAEEFMSAYGSRIKGEVASRLLNTLEVRMVMFVHQKKYDTRASFSSLPDIAHEFYHEAKQQDGLLPNWVKLGSKPKSSNLSNDGPKIGALRETCGIINASILAEKGFVVNRQMINVETRDIYTITTLNKDEKTVSCTLFEAGSKKGKKPAEKISVDRADLLSGDHWHSSSTTQPTFLETTTGPLNNFELTASIVAGACKNAMALEFAKSCDDDIKVQTAPECKLFAIKAFKKVGSLKLVGLTNNISVQPDGKELLTSAKFIGQGAGWKAYCRSSNSSLTNASSSSFFLAKHYLVHSTFDQNLVNCEYEDKEVDISVLGNKEKIMVPMIVNTKSIAVGDEIIVLRVSPEPPAAEPPAKKRKIAPKGTAMKK